MKNVYVHIKCFLLIWISYYRKCHIIFKPSDLYFTLHANGASGASKFLAQEYSEEIYMYTTYIHNIIGV